MKHNNRYLLVLAIICFAAFFLTAAYLSQHESTVLLFSTFAFNGFGMLFLGRWYEVVKKAKIFPKIAYVIAAIFLMGFITAFQQ